MVHFLDNLFSTFHTLLILFNLTGWIFERTRRIHLVVISFTFLSWFALGVCFGYGYCPLTEWHWKVKMKLGVTDLPNSYIKYCADKLTGMSFDPLLIDLLVLLAGLAALIMSLWLNFRAGNPDTKNKKKPCHKGLKDEG